MVLAETAHWRHTNRARHSASYLLVALDNLDDDHYWAVRWVPLEDGCIADLLWLDRIFTRYRSEAVMRFAACAYLDVGRSGRDRGPYWQINLAGTAALLKAMWDHKVAVFKFSSSRATSCISDQLSIAADQGSVQDLAASVTTARQSPEWRRATTSTSVIARANVLALEDLLAGGSIEALNLGIGRG